MPQPLPPSTQFGRLISASQIEEATVAQIQLWYNDYARQAERQFGMNDGDIPSPISYTTRNRYTSLPGEELPKCVVISPGLAHAPEKYGGAYRAVWRLGVAIAISHKDEVFADALSKGIAALLRLLLVQQSNIGQLGAKIEWVDETYNDLQVANQNMFGKVCSVFYTVDIESVATKRVRPTVPNLPPTDYDYSQVHTVEVDLELEAITNES